MEVKLVCLCRGLGFSYALISVEGKAKKINCRLNRGKYELPCMFWGLDNEKTNKSCVKYIVQMPLVKGIIRLCVDLIDERGSVVSKKSFCLPSFYTACRSKLEGKVNKDNCLLLRNSNLRFGRQGDADIVFSGLLFHRECWYIKGKATFYSEAKDVGFSAFDNHGNKLKFVLLSSQCQCAQKVDKQFTRCNFVIKLKKIKSSVFLGIRNSLGSNWLALECASKDQIKRLKKKHIANFTDAFSDANYLQWFLLQRASVCELAQQKKHLFSLNPKFSIIVPLYKTPLNFFYEMVESVLAQTYKNWELILVNASPEDHSLEKAVEEKCAFDERIVKVELKKNCGITENTNEGIKNATGDYLCFFDHDDTLEPNLLFEYAWAINKNPKIDLLYCDEDKLLPNGTYANPTFKPDFNLDLLRDNNYICHLLTVKKATHTTLAPATKSLDGAQDHSLTLQVAEKGGVFYHVPKILYHWRISETSTAANANSKPYATDAGIYAVSEHLKRSGISAEVECSHGRAFRYKVNYEIKENSLVSIIVTSRAFEDEETLKFLQKTLMSNKHRNLELLLPLSGKAPKKAEELSFEFNGKVIEYTASENAVAEINEAINKSSGDYCIFITNKIAGSKQETWFDTLFAHCSRCEVGIVGPMTVDKADFIIEAGLTVVGSNMAVRLSSGQYFDAPGYIYRPLSTQEVYAVGINGMMLKKSVVGKGCLLEELSLDENAILLCETTFEKGYKVIYTPEAALVCCEELPQTFSLSNEKARRDGFFNPNFSSIPERAIHYGLSDGISKDTGYFIHG